MDGRNFTTEDRRVHRRTIGRMMLAVWPIGLLIGCSRPAPPAAPPAGSSATRMPAADVRSDRQQVPSPVENVRRATPTPAEGVSGRGDAGQASLRQESPRPESPRPESLGRIDVTDWDRLRQQVGQRVTVFGRISRATKSRAGHQFLNFAGSDLKLVCFRDDLRQFTDGSPVDRFADQDVEVSGLLELYQGQPQIKLKVPDQIRADRPADRGLPEGADRAGGTVVDGAVNAEEGTAAVTVELRKIGENEWLSPAGLIYRGRDAEGRTRLEHVLRHAADEPRRVGSHGVFEGGRDGALTVIDEAWNRIRQQKIRPQLEEGREAYLVSMGRRVGYRGGQAGADRGNPPLHRVRLVVREGTSEVVTAYPD